MSVYYEVREHVILKNDAAEEIKDSVVEAIAQIGYRMLLGHSAIWKLALKADEKVYLFAGRDITPDLHEIIRVIEDAQTIDLVMDYDGVNFEFPIAESVKETLENHPACEDDLFYSLYNKADCASGAGILSAYGKKNEKTYSGVVALEEATSLVEGEWISEDTVVVFDDDVTEDMDVEGIKKCVSDFADMGADIDFDEETTQLFLNYITLKSVSDIERFVEIYQTLDRATCSKCGYLAEFSDRSTDDARVMVIDFAETEVYTVRVASVD